MLQPPLNADLFKQLTEADHPYSCDGEYGNERFASVADFIKAQEGYDADLNLILRWDFYDGEEIHGTGLAPDALYGAEGTKYCKIVYILQRKGVIRADYILNVTPEEIPALVRFLKPRWEKIKSLWEPLPEVFDQLPDPRTQLLERIKNVIDFQVQAHGHTQTKVIRNQLRSVSEDVVRDILHILHGTDVHPGFELFERTSFGDRREGDLAEDLHTYFDLINT